MVSGGGIFLLIVLSYALLIAPLRSNLVRMKEGASLKKAELLWMQNAAVQAEQLAALRSSKSAVSPLKMIDQTARHYGIDASLKRVDPGEDNKIKVWFEELVYLDFVKFLRGIGGDQGLAITSLAVERLDAPGIVNARATFKATTK